MATGSDLLKRIAALEKKADLADQLQKENEILRQQLQRASGSRDQLLEDNHLKQAKIDALEKQLKTAQIKIRKWRRHYTLSSSPARSDGVISDATATVNLSSDGALCNDQALICSHIETPVACDTGRLDVPQARRKVLSETPGNVARTPPSRKRRAGSQGVDGVSILAEDGEDDCSVKQEHGNPAHPQLGSAAHRRVSDLLSGTKPPLQVLRPGRKSRAFKITPSADQLSKAQLFLPPNDISLENTNRRPASHLPPKKRSSAGAEDEEPFRSRPLHRLSLAHFKLDPASNGGLEHAYSDVVRDRAQRRCLPACTRPCCASTFKALATLSESAVSDDDLLRAFLGPNSDLKISNLTAVTRANLLEEARTKLVADRYGKHRNAHDRAQSPPGFWRTDMPGTQEESEDRELARLKEREEVERRYNEACRVDGKWTFADE